MTSGGISSAAPICLIMASVNLSYPAFGCFGSAKDTVSPGFNPTIAPLPSSTLLWSSASISIFSGSISPNGRSSVAVAGCTNTVNMAEMTAALISASVYRPNCLSASSTGARTGTPRSWPARSRVITWTMFRRPVSSPRASTRVHSRPLPSMDVSERGCRLHTQ